MRQIGKQPGLSFIHWETISKLVDNNFIDLINKQGTAVPEDIRSDLSEQETMKMDSLYNELSNYGRVFNRLNNQMITMQKSWEDKSAILYEVQQDVANDAIINQTEDKIQSLQETLTTNQDKLKRMQEILKTANTGSTTVAAQLTEQLTAFTGS